MEPFTAEEKAALFDRLDALTVPALESYIGSARASLGNKALAPTWRPRVELALLHAEAALARADGIAAAAEAKAERKPATPAPKAKKTAA